MVGKRGNASASTLLRDHRHFGRDRSGAALVEFSLIASMLLFSILYIVELGLTHMTTLQLESATGNIARVVRTGRIDSLKELSRDRAKGAKLADEKLTEADIRAFVCARMVFAVNCIGKTRVYIDNVTKLKGIVELQAKKDPFKKENDKLPNPDVKALSGREYVQVQVILRSPLSILGYSYDIEASTVLRNEPF